MGRDVMQIFGLLLIGLALAAPCAAQARAGATNATELDAILRDIKARDTDQLAVSEEDGRFLRVLIATSGARRVLEIGGASGYSAIWMAQAVRANGGRLVTLEYDRARARELRENIRRAGLSDVVQVVAGDAFAEIPKLPGSFDFVFLDAWKKDYQRFFELVYPRLDAGGLLVAHNVVNKKSEMGDFLDTIETHPELWTTIVAPSGEGVSVSIKRPRSPLMPTTVRPIHIIGVPLDLGAGRRGVDMGPSALRIAGLDERLAALGCRSSDGGTSPRPSRR
jgi:predicted O-methyltransferase YrrM